MAHTQTNLARLHKVCMPTIEAARRGELRDEDARKLCSGALVSHMMVPSMLTIGRVSAGDGTRTAATTEQTRIASLCRPLFTRKAAWALFTVEWMDSLASLIRELVEEGSGHSECGTEAAKDGDASGTGEGGSGCIRVLEVCAGASTLQDPMRARGLDWIATDLEGSEEAVSPPLRMAAEEAVRMEPPIDVCFWSWWTTPERRPSAAVCSVAASATVAFSSGACRAVGAAGEAVGAAGEAVGAAGEAEEAAGETDAVEGEAGDANDSAAAEVAHEATAVAEKDTAESDAESDVGSVAPASDADRASGVAGGPTTSDAVGVIREPWHDDVYGRWRPEGWRRDVSALAARALVPMVLSAAVCGLGREGDLVHVDAAYATDFLLA